MNKLKFSKDEGTDFYKELNEKIEQFFTEKEKRKKIRLRYPFWR